MGSKYLGLLSMRIAPSWSLVPGIIEWSELANILANIQPGSRMSKVDLQIHI